jgi:hypothetical protein
VLSKLDDAEVVVEDLSGPTVFIDTDEHVQGRLKSLCHSESMANLLLAEACGTSIRAIPQQARATR